MDISKITSTEGMIVDGESVYKTRYISGLEYPQKVVILFPDGDAMGWTWKSEGIKEGFDFWSKSDGTFGKNKYIIRL